MNVYLYPNNTETSLKNAYIGEYGWKPWDNTIAYFPFEMDKSNQISWWPMLSTSTTTISTIWWVKALYCDGTQSQTLNIWFRVSDIASCMFWYYSTDNSWVRTLIGEQSTSADRWIVTFNSTLRYSRQQNDVTADIDTTQPSANSWHCLWISEWNNWGKMFLDWVQVWTNSSTRDYSTLTLVNWVACWNTKWTITRQFKWYMSKLVLINSDISLEDYQDFYNQTKSNYWL